MPRLPKGAVPRYRKHKASGQAVCTIAGKDHYLGRHGTKASLIKYDRLITEWLAAGRPTSFGKPVEELLVLDLLVRYLRFAKSYYRKTGHASSEHEKLAHAFKPLKEIYGRTPVAEFGPLQMKAMRQKYLEMGLTRQGVNRRLGYLRRLFKWGVGEGLVPPPVHQALTAVEGLKKGRTEAPECQPIEGVPESAVQAVLPHLTKVVSDMVQVQRLTGCRPGEVCVLRPGDVDRTSEIWVYRPREHKNQYRGQERLVYIGPKAQKVLMPNLLRPADSFCFSPSESERKRLAEQHANRTTPLSCGNRPGLKRKPNPKRSAGGRYDVASYRRAIHRACDKAFPAPEPLGRASGETKRAWMLRLTQEQKKEHASWQARHRWSPNQLRHAAATEIRARFGLEAAQTILGHLHCDVTQVYAARDAALAVRVAAEVG
jgi:integrase